MAFVCQVTSVEKEAQNSSSVRSSGKPYQAPYARLSSLEDPCTAKPENGKTPSTRLETETMGVKAQASLAAKWPVTLVRSYLTNLNP